MFPYRAHDGGATQRPSRSPVREELADDRRPRNAVNLTAYCRFFRDTEILVYHARDTRIVTICASASRPSRGG